MRRGEERQRGVFAFFVHLTHNNIYRYQDTFAKWIQARKKVYSNSEFQTRYAIFKDNMDFVQKWNADPSHTHTGMSQHIFNHVTSSSYSNNILDMIKQLINT